MTDTIPQAGAAASRPSRGFTRFLPPIGRILMGLLFLLTGLNGFLNFMPPPDPMPEAVAEFMGALMKTHYMMPLIAGTQLAAAILLLVNRFVPFALVLIAPVIVNIILFHAFVQPAGIGPGAVVLVIELGLVWAYRDSYRTLFAAKVVPSTARQ